MTDLGLIAIAAGIAVCAGLGTGIGEGIAASKAVEAADKIIADKEKELLTV